MRLVRLGFTGSAAGDREVVKGHKQKKRSSWGEGLGGRGRYRVSVSSTTENHEMIGQGWKPILQINYNCSWIRIWPSTWKFHFIWTNLSFEGSNQLLRTNSPGSLVGPSVLRGDIWEGGEGRVWKEKQRQSLGFPGRSKWLCHMLGGLQLQFKGPWCNYFMKTREMPGLPTSLSLRGLWRTVRVLPPICP